MHHTTLIALVAVALQSSQPSYALAQVFPKPRPALVADLTDDPVLGIVGSGVAHADEAPASPVPRECKPRYMVGPGLGVPLGVGAIITGSVFTWAGATGVGYDFLVPRDRFDRGLIAAGSLTIAAGVAAVVLSAIQISKNADSRQRLCGGTRI